MDTQTDAFDDRPETAEFVPQKTGVDASTQIEASDSLFDLHAEIQPLLDVLVGKVKRFIYFWSVKASEMYIFPGAGKQNVFAEAYIKKCIFRGIVSMFHQMPEIVLPNASPTSFQNNLPNLPLLFHMECRYAPGNNTGTI